MTLSVICSRPRGLAGRFGFGAAFVRGFVADFAAVDLVDVFAAVVFAAVVFAAVVFAAVVFAGVDLAVVDFFGVAVAEPALGDGTSVLVSARAGNTDIAFGRCTRLCWGRLATQHIGRLVSIEIPRDFATIVSKPTSHC
jgi:hypothetical protein